MTYESDIPVYPGRTDVSLKKKKWALIAKDILRREGREDIPVFIEPGTHYFWKERKTFIQKVKELFFGESTQVLGTHLYTTKNGFIERQSIHIREEAPAANVMDTIVHEIAHALKPFANHNDEWKEEYRRLRAKYILNPIVKSDNDEGYMKSMSLEERARIIIPKALSEYAVVSIEDENGTVHRPNRYELKAFVERKIPFKSLMEKI